MKITIVGAGYVGTSLAVLMSQLHQVTILEIDEEKIKKINSRHSPIEDEMISDFLKNKKLDIYATSNINESYLDTDLVIICTPTNYDTTTAEFNTSAVTSSIENANNINPKCSIFIKSTVPVGFTSKMRKKFNKKNIYFSPEFLREGTAIRDNLFPSRIIVGGTDKEAEKFAKLLKDITRDNKNPPPIELMDSSESEAIKLFANTYLAMRVSYFNELDSYCEIHGLNTLNVVRGIGHDPRIGNYYNNPSFGYGGYCLPKDTRQLLKNYENVPNSLIKAIVEANTTRKNFIADRIINRNPSTIGIYRLIMKEKSDNIRDSAVQGIMKRVKAKGINVIVYEPLITEKQFFGSEIIKDFETFAKSSEIIVANRITKELIKYYDKVYTRDLFAEK